MVLHASEVLINARGSTVWDVLTDAGNITVWNSGITDLNGDPRDGETVRFTTPRRDRPVRARVRQQSGELMTLTSALPLRLLRVVRSFALIPGSGRTLLKVTVESSGPLRRWSSPTTQQDLDDFVAAARHRAELLDRTS
ncbi:SRPBCC family protein [Arthrobacter sp. NPDC058097]|uniref:SRPBCC family protein n=1 Tax=Arthrobacter sp. NPDC058097 TaxID=3346340 RepID=UPI0036D9FA2A